MKWITRERPKIDRIACPWLISRFIDKNAEFVFSSPAEIMNIAVQTSAIPFDVPNVELTHVGEFCSFDAFIKKYELKDASLIKLADIVRAADTNTLSKSPQAAGLLAISLGLGENFPDDQELLKEGMKIYDALYTWCRSLTSETHSWNYKS
jgi:hypothetical protein